MKPGPVLYVLTRHPTNAEGIMRVEHWNTNDDGVLTEHAMRQKLEAAGYQTARYVYPPGTHFDWHTHREDKRDAVVSGRFKISFVDAEYVLTAGDIVDVPRNVPHAAEVVGPEPVVSLDAVRTPR
jgi:quercetin dioxygenase-like cupin family protein